MRTKRVTPYSERAFSRESVKLPVIRFDPVELGTAGSAQWVTATVHPLKDERGRVAEVVSMHEDITD